MVIRRWVCCVNLIGFGNLFFVSDGLEFVLAVCTMFSSLHLPFFSSIFLVSHDVFLSVSADLFFVLGDFELFWGRLMSI